MKERLIDSDAASNDLVISWQRGMDAFDRMGQTVRHPVMRKPGKRNRGLDFMPHRAIMRRAPIETQHVVLSPKPAEAPPL